MFKICKYVIYDILRSKVILAYTVFLFMIAFSLFGLQEDVAKSMISLTSIMMILVPLVSIIFSTTYFYNTHEFIELLVAQPIGRRTILLGVFSGISLSLVTAFAVGIGIPVMLYSPDLTGVIIICSGTALTLSFVALAVLSSVATRDKAKGIGIAIMLWFYFSVIYDAMVLGILFAFNDYPLEKAVIALASMNPIDMGRIMILLQLDISSLMGFTGAVYKEFFGSNSGMFFTIFVMLLWIVIPVFLALRIFNKKNL